MRALNPRNVLRSISTVAALIVLLLAVAQAEDASPEDAAIKALQGNASNIQKNRDGTVRFVRFSRANVTDEHVQQTAAFPRLDYLAVVAPNTTDAGITHLGQLTNLDTLFLEGPGFTDASAEAIGSLPKLEYLFLDRTQITDAGLSKLTGLKTLKTLSLVEAPITNAGLAHLSSLTNLEVVVLSRCNITDAGLAHLSPLTSLRQLSLDGTKITGTGFGHLGPLEKLKGLDLSDTAVQADQLAALGKLTSLEVLLLDRTSADATALQGLRTSLPKTVVSAEPPLGDKKSPYAKLLAGNPLAAVTTTRQLVEIPTEGTVLPSGRDRFTTEAEPPGVQRHGVPLLGRLGCNGRSCHGSVQGKGGFRLSMFGYDFAADIDALTGGETPRVNKADPQQSLMLRKPTEQEPHEGGQRFELGGWEHRLLSRWIEAGAKGVAGEPQTMVELQIAPRELLFARVGQEVQLRAIAVWSDGTREDVTPLTRFQSKDDAIAHVTPNGLVRCVGSGDTHVISYYDNGVIATPALLPVTEQTGEKYPEVPTPTPIDALVAEKLLKLGIVPSEPASDAEFLRRVSLDIAGTLPAPAEILAFVEDSSSDKRARKVDELLETPAYVDWWTNQLSDLTGCNSQYLGTTDMNTPAAGQWAGWIRSRIEQNVGWDRIAAGILLAHSRDPGESYSQYAARQSRFLDTKDRQDFGAIDNPMHYYWFRSNNVTPDDRTLSFGYIFLGVRLQCAQCHKHPFDQWSKQDFDQFKELFTRIQMGVSPQARVAQEQLKTKLGVPTKLDTAALRRQMYLRVAAEGLPIPWNEIWIQPPGDKPQTARLLGGEAFDLNEFEDPREPLVAWLLSDDNPYFARAMVNRIWAHYFGVGIVDPPDDFNLANPPSNAKLLDWLADGFAANGYDLKWLHRTITGSQTYQLSCRPNETNKADERNFSRSLIRRLPAEVTIDAILQATSGEKQLARSLTDVAYRKIAQHPKSIQARGVDYSLLIFGKPLRTTNCDCEREMQPTLLQSLYVRNDQEVLEWIERADGWLTEVSRQTGQSLSSDLKPPEAALATVTAPQPVPVDATTVENLIQSAFLRTLSRPPQPEEMTRARRHLAESENAVEGLRDLLWALLNTEEFLTNH